MTIGVIMITADRFRFSVIGKGFEKNSLAPFSPRARSCRGSRLLAQHAVGRR